MITPLTIVLIFLCRFSIYWHGSKHRFGVGTAILNWLTQGKAALSSGNKMPKNLRRHAIQNYLPLVSAKINHVGCSAILIVDETRENKQPRKITTCIFSPSSSIGDVDVEDCFENRNAIDQKMRKNILAVHDLLRRKLAKAGIPGLRWNEDLSKKASKVIEESECWKNGTAEGRKRK